MCFEVVSVHALLQEVAPASAELRPPDAIVVWRRAQSLARKKATATAAQPIFIARIGTVVTVAIALLWLVLTQSDSPSWIHNLTRVFRTYDLSFSSAATGTFLLATIGSLFLITVSSWYVLRRG
jgi:lysylphosphatidylglycerol synthetase-like protein (DUF2156 family)